MSYLKIRYIRHFEKVRFQIAGRRWVERAHFLIHNLVEKLHYSIKTYNLQDDMTVHR